MLLLDGFVVGSCVCALHTFSLFGMTAEDLKNKK